MCNALTSAHVHLLNVLVGVPHSVNHWLGFIRESGSLSFFCFIYLVGNCEKQPARGAIFFLACDSIQCASVWQSDFLL